MTDPMSAGDRPPSDRAGASFPPKAPPPPLMGRAPRPTAVRIRKPVVRVMVAGAALLLSGSLAWAFIIQPELRAKARDAAQADRLDETHGGVRPSDRVTDQPSSYDRLPPPAHGSPSLRGGKPEDAPDPVDAPARIPTYGRPASAQGPNPAQQAAASGLFFAPASSAATSPRTLATGPTSSADPARNDYSAIYSPHGLIAPVSPYELKAGSIVPGVLLTAVDTSRPGPVVATVTQNVFDSVTGRHLVLPQGTRLIGRHEGESAHGDRRAFLVWDRLILPNGKSLILAGEPAVDSAGAVGVEGRADRRLWSLGVASLFAGAITTLGELARGGSQDRSFIGSAGDAASIEASQVGGRLIDRELGVRPTLRVRAGAPVRVMITRDLVLEPYRR